MSKKLSTQEKARRMWVRALRSGKYGWGKRSLNPKEGRYCCLGVLCEVAIKQGIISSYNPGIGYLPDDVIKWVGLSGKYGKFGSPNPLYGGESLVEINDSSKRNPFLKISNIIDKSPEGLFKDKEQA
jgi:hypothetical protein